MVDPEQVDLLIVDDDTEFRSTLARRFLRRGYRVQEASSGEEALANVEKRHFHVAILDMMMPGMSGIDLLKLLKTADPDCQAIMLTGQGSIETAVEAMKLGANDYLAKPFPLAELEVLIQKSYERGQLGKENQRLKQVLSSRHGDGEMIGDSPPMIELRRLIQRAGPTNSAILIQGESGTGKELVARSLHRHSLQADKPMVTVNCAALPETLLESELFGHEKGSFTGAISTKLGLFEVADGGTLFIDEIGEMPGSLQAKLLRVLENGEMRRIGSLKERRVHVRLLAATNRNMQEEVKAGRFREDLFYRINVMSLETPPLRDHSSDIPLLVRHMLGSDWKIDPAAMRALETFHWPGNVRQLSNALERAKIMADDHTIHVCDLPHEVARTSPNGTPPQHTSSADDLASIERTHILEILGREHGNKAKTARALGINRRSLYRLLEKYHIDADSKPEKNQPPT